MAELPTKAEVNAVLAMPVYGTAPWNSSSDGFRNHLEGWRGACIHNRVHVWVGGQVTSAASPSDPVFWMHHAFIDMLWAEWQHRHPKSTYLFGAGTPDVVDLKDTMRPWNNVPPADMLDHRKFYTFRHRIGPRGRWRQTVGQSGAVDLAAPPAVDPGATTRTSIRPS